jgi:hypothetical protein
MPESLGGVTRRRALLTAAVGGAAVATTALTPTAASAAPSPTVISVLGHDVDVSRATPEVVSLLADYFRAKTSRDVTATMAHFARPAMTYIDATLGWPWYDWQDLDSLFAQLMPTWPATAQSYPTKILGDSTSALVWFTDTPELFGHEIRPFGMINFVHGKIVRWVDYWDGREFTLAGIAAQRTPADEFPTDFKESTVGEAAGPSVRRVAHALAEALAADDPAAVTALFSPDGVLTDRTLHTTVVGRQDIGSYLGRALGQLPYGPGSTVRHVVGGGLGGGYEWRNDDGPVFRGASALELDRAGLLTQLSVVWDGSLLTDSTLYQMQARTIEE